VITLSVFRRQISLSPTLQAVAKASASRRGLQVRFQQQLNQCLVDYQPSDTLEVHEDLLRWCIWQFSEQVVFEPLEELGIWFNYSSGQFLSPGYPPLYYSRAENRPVSPSKTAIAGIGEGIAGFLAQRLYHCRKLARPIHDFPDVVMVAEDAVIYLVESKASTGLPESLRQTIDAEVIRLAAYASACSELNTRPIRGLLVGTALNTETEYQAFLTEVLV
jgi:hypothetical protein